MEIWSSAPCSDLHFFLLLSSPLVPQFLKSLAWRNRLVSPLTKNNGRVRSRKVAGVSSVGVR